MSDFPDLIEPVTRLLLGEPNRHLSTKDEWRFGTNGSLSVKVGGKHKGTWRDHEAGDGGGVLALIARVEGGDNKSAIEWLRVKLPDHAGPPEQSGPLRVVAAYPYHDEAGDLLFEVVRLEPKTFRQRRPDGLGGFTWKLNGVRHVPYHLPEILEALAHDRTVYIAEGEKDVDRLWALGIPATCNSGGAGKWRDDFAVFFEGADVVILPDNDDAGRDHADKVARSLQSVASRVRVLALPDLPRKGDVSDWLAACGTVETLNSLAISAPTWRPTVTVRYPVVWYGDEDASPPLSWLVKGLFVEGGLSTVYGPPGTSKTFVALDMALHIAHGRDWFGRRVMTGGVIYVSGEGSPGMLQRMKAWKLEKGDGSRAPFALLPSSVNLFDDDIGADALIADVHAHASVIGVPLRLVVLDTLSRMIGSGDEDKARDINQVVQRAEKIQRETGAHVLIVHHSGKDRDRGMRGSNALLGAVDAAIEISRHEESGICEGKIIKVKDGSADNPFRYTLRQSVLGIDEDGEDITSCVIDSTDASPGEIKGKSKLSDAEVIALEALAEATLEHGVTQPIASVPAGGRAVQIDEWRRCAYEKGISDGDAAAKRQAFHRIRQKLQRKHIVGVEGDWAWRATT